MFKIPDELVTQVRAGEQFVVAKMGLGEASICGEKVVVKVKSDGLKLGQRFFATANNKLIRRLGLTDIFTPDTKSTLIFNGNKVN